MKIPSTSYSGQYSEADGRLIHDQAWGREGATTFVVRIDEYEAGEKIVYPLGEPTLEISQCILLAVSRVHNNRKLMGKPMTIETQGASVRVAVNSVYEG